ncbi:MAG: transglutaminase domain-containing protein [Chitinophagaceae bacterium]|nr:transglutaminase domain-containing protein [Chitinophagaceae bacterium]
MSNARKNIQWQYKAVCLLIGAILLSCTADAQLSLKRQKYDSIAARYKNEHAIYTNITHKLVIKEEDGGLAATSTVSQEKLFISDRSVSVFNRDEINGVYGIGFSDAYNLATVSYLPERNDYKRVVNTDKLGDPSLSYTGLKKNALTHTSFIMEHRELRLLPHFAFSNNLPTVAAIYEITAPKYVKMGFLLKGADTNLVKKTVTERNGNMVYTFTAMNVPAEKEYSDVPSDRYYRPHVIPYVISYRLTGAKKDSVLAGTPDAHHKFEYKYVKGLNLENDNFLNKKSAELIRGAYSDRDKVQRIYDWVQKTFHYKALYDNELEGLVPHQADTVCKRLFGDCKDMSSVFMAMCAKAGVPSYWVAIGTHDKPYTHEELQSEYLYDHMICAVKLDGEWVFLDGTTHVQPLGANRPDLQGKEAFIMMDDHTYKIVPIAEVAASSNIITDNTVMNLSYTDVSGTISRNLSGYPAWDMGEALAFMNRKNEKDIFIHDELERGNAKFLLQNYSVNASNSGRKDVYINAAYTLGGYVQQAKKETFVNMNLQRTLADTRVNDEDRNVAFHMPYKKTVRETVTLNVPKGYRVTYVPKAAKGGVNGLWSYNISYAADKKAGTVTLTKEIVVHSMKIEPAKFAEHNKAIDELKKQYKETVVLTGK